jgi:hypothetical protein
VTVAEINFTDKQEQQLADLLGLDPPLEFAAVMEAASKLMAEVAEAELLDDVDATMRDRPSQPRY